MEHDKRPGWVRRSRRRRRTRVVRTTSPRRPLDNRPESVRPRDNRPPGHRTPDRAALRSAARVRLGDRLTAICVGVGASGIPTVVILNFVRPTAVALTAVGAIAAAAFRATGTLARRRSR